MRPVTRNTLVMAALALAPTATMAARPITPIEHVVVIFQENVSFDHYFGTYPQAANTGAAGEPLFHARANTPSVNGLQGGGLLTNNPNGVNPFRLSRAQAATCDQDHDYTDEQAMFDLGLMDNFLAFNGGCDPNAGHPDDLIMGYYDGNTVTALWNYAQHFALNDNSYGTTFGPSTPGALNLVSGNTNGTVNLSVNPSAAGDVADGSVISDPQPADDVCTTRDNLSMVGTNVGDLLNAAGVSWGFFQGGFDLTITNPNGTTGCKRSSTSITDAFPPKVDYIPHHEPFQYYPSTRNPMHVRPSSVRAIGHDDGGVNHQYDLHDFFDAVRAGNFPSVAFLKAAGYQDGHAGYSSPIDEQPFLVDTINFLQTRPEWARTLIVVAYDDSDGWYDHQMSPIVSQSVTSADVVNGQALCGSKNSNGIGGRCGYGPRLPLLVISPFARENFVDHTLTDQSSILRFVEDNWRLPRIENSFDAIAGPLTNMLDFSRDEDRGDRTLLLDPASGQLLDSGEGRADGPHRPGAHG